MTAADYLAWLPLTFGLRMRTITLTVMGLVISLAMLAGFGIFLPWFITDVLSHAKHDKAAYFLFVHPGEIFWFFLYIAFAMLASTMARIGDVLQDGPLLTIEAEGLRDRRFAEALIPWSNIATYDLVTGKNRSVANITLYLRMAPAGPIRRLRLFLRAVAALKRPRRTTLRLDIVELTRSSGDICRLIVAMVEHHGGKRRSRWYEPQV
ncbi:MAG TPA: hypothetical protein VL462_00890 [Candidatus Nitrosotalea sp.]|jgi:hypothetical protein|nr:hypothetical protein [Candidatus Nitrosotalea sp.]